MSSSVHAAETVLVDAGPLVALFDPSVGAHEICKRELGKLRHWRRITTPAVLTEATYLLGFSKEAGSAALVVLAEKLGVTKVFTLDRRDFGVYRLGRRVFRVVPEWKGVPRR